MALFAIGDLHLSLEGKKPMDVFDGWQNYTKRLEANWRRLITDDDTVVLAGDNSWAMKLNDCRADFAFIHDLPGKKLMMKGNHDYWWSTITKMRRYIDENNFNSISFLFNNAYCVDNMAICGTRSWLFDPDEENDALIMGREMGRLRISLQEAEKNFPAAEKLVFLHYPPVYYNTNSPEMIEIMNEFGVKRCFYGHLHSASIRWAVQGDVDGICYKLISADALQFQPEKIRFSI